MKLPNGPLDSTIAPGWRTPSARLNELPGVLSRVVSLISGSSGGEAIEKLRVTPRLSGSECGNVYRRYCPARNWSDDSGWKKKDAAFSASCCWRTKRRCSVVGQSPLGRLRRLQA